MATFIITPAGTAAPTVTPTNPANGPQVVRDNSDLYKTLTISVAVIAVVGLAIAGFNGFFSSAKQEARKDLAAVTDAYVAVNTPTLTESLALVGQLRNPTQIVVNNRQAMIPNLSATGATLGPVSTSGHATNKTWAVIEACLVGLGLTPTADFYSKVGADGRPRATLTAPGHAKVLAAGKLPNAIACN